MDRGVNRSAGLLAGRGMLLRAQNARYVPGHPDALYALLGRALFDSVALPDPSTASADTNPKRIFSVIFDDGTRRLVLHRGGTLYEATIGGTGTFAEVYALSSGTNLLAPGGFACSYGDKWFYIDGNAGGIDWGASTFRRAFVRTSAGWRRAGHGKPPAPLVAGSTGILYGGDPGPNNPVFSSTPVRYLYRIYDEGTNTESQHSDYVEIPAFTAPEGNYVAWPTPPTSPTDLGTHVRLYRTLRNQPPGAYFRIDGNGPGWTLAFVAANYYDTTTHRFVDTVENNASIENGSVDADGIEGEEAWAEWGGAVPPARGGTIFQDRLVLWGIVTDEDAVYWSALAQPELFPVKFDGTYPYRMTFQSKRKDRVQTCVAAGQFLIVLGEEAVFRVQALRDFNGAGADLRSQDLITDEDGCAGERAAAAFGIGQGQAQYVVYVSRKSGVCVTDGIRNDSILKELDVLSLIDPSYIQNVVIENYPRYQELAIAYTPVGGTRNTQAILVDYSNLGRRGGFRVTWPVDVAVIDLHHAYAADGIGRLYVLDQDAKVFVQDSGTTDAQKNTNEDGDIVLDWRTARELPAGQGNTAHALRGLVYGSAGVARSFKTTHSAQDGVDEYDQIDAVQVGPGETSDSFDANGRGSGHRLVFYYRGPTGDSYDGSGTDAPQIRFCDLELVGVATQPRTRTTP